MPGGFAVLLVGPATARAIGTRGAGGPQPGWAAMQFIEHCALSLPIATQPGHARIGGGAAFEQRHKAGQLVLVTQPQVVGKAIAQVPQAHRADRQHGQHHGGRQQQRELVGDPQAHGLDLSGRPGRQAFTKIAKTAFCGRG